VWIGDRTRTPGPNARLVGPAPSAYDRASLRPLIEDAVQIVEDAIDATSEHIRDPELFNAFVPSARTGQAVVDALLEAGWTPPIRP
jgi:hypothetical protein